jgi:hypothetical protein
LIEGRLEASDEVERSLEAVHPHLLIISFHGHLQSDITINAMTFT